MINSSSPVWLPYSSVGRYVKMITCESFSIIDSFSENLLGLEFGLPVLRPRQLADRDDGDTGLLRQRAQRVRDLREALFLSISRDSGHELNVIDDHQLNALLANQ